MSILCQSPTVPVVAEGHIRKRGNAWQVIVFAGRDPVTGRKRQVSRTVRGTKRDAQAVRSQLLVQVGEGAHIGTDATFGQLLDEWYETAAGDWSPKTAIETKRFIERLIRPKLGSVRLRKLSPAVIDRFYGDLRKRGGLNGRPLSPASVRRVHVIVRRSLQQAVKWGWLATNPAANASPPRTLPSRITPPSPDDVSRLLSLARAEDPDLGVFLRLAAATGARRGELCALRWSDVDFDARTVTIQRSLVGGTDGFVEKDTKTHAARCVALDDETVEILADHRRRAMERVLATGSRAESLRYVFSFDPAHRSPWRPDGVTARFARLRHQAGLNGVRLHDLRHYVATRLIGAGVPVRTVSGRLGHANAATTLNVYSHFLAASDRDAAELLGRLLDDGRAGAQTTSP